MLNEPGSSPYDLHFNFLGFPVRIAWGFWIVAAILGWNWSGGVDYMATVYEVDSPGAPILLLIWIAALLLSILIHEVGHTLAMKYYGLRSRIVLYHFGGLAIPDSFGSWDGARQRRIGPQEQIVISAAGPALQLALAAVVYAIGLAMGVPMPLTGQLNWLFGLEIPNGAFTSSIVGYAVFSAILFPSTIWAILNLAPILPLDGGQIMRNALILANISDPTRRAQVTSIVVGGLLGLLAFRYGQPGGIMFLLLAASNWQSMQMGPRGF